MQESLPTSRTPVRRSRHTQCGSLILVTLVILAIVTVLGVSTMDSARLEMEMSSNSRSYQEAFEAAEYTLAWVEADIAASSFFSTDSLANITPACGTVCFSSSCTNGYCFNGINPDNTSTCKLDAPTLQPYQDAAIWSTASKHRTLAVPNTSITAKYIIEYRCYTSRDPTLPYSNGNSTRMFRITTYVVGEGGRSRIMLRSMIKQV